ncbi:MAG: pyruvate, phosphate dikinase [Ilumatobacter sp.]
MSALVSTSSAPAGGPDVLGMSFLSAGGLDATARAGVLGGKGAALAQMVSLGLPVPPGFTLTTTACHAFADNGWSADLDLAVVEGLRELEASTGRRFGDPATPLLVSVRSGAPVSMPGMMDTVLNAGMTIAAASGLCAATGDARFGWDTLRRFLQSYALVVLEAPADRVRSLSEEHLGSDDGQHLDPAQLAAAVQLLDAGLAAAGYAVPDDPQEQVREAAQAVFRSWNSERAKVYRNVEGIDDELGTAATIQAMVFGNLGDRSGTGVAFSRDPSSGEPHLMGDFLQQAQGEDVVAGTHQTLPIAALADLWPDVATELDRTATLLEHELADLVDIEFTVEDGSFWLLQVRRGKRSPRAALRMAIDMADDPDFPLTRTEALERVVDVLADPPMLSSGPSGSSDVEVLATGLAASPGRGVGVMYTDVDDAVEADARGEAVILIRRETSPADIAGMAVARGIVTTLGGVVSHAAVVARGWGVPAVVGASGLEVLTDGIRIGERFVASGSELTVDGDTGEVIVGAHHADEVEVPEVAVLRAWARDVEVTASVTDSRHAEEVTADTVGRALALKGMADADAIAIILGGTVEQVEPVLAALVGAGKASEMPRGRVRATPELKAEIDESYAADAAIVRHDIDAQMEEFHTLDASFKALVTDWQMRTVDGEQIPNDHTDADYDGAIIGRLRADVHPTIGSIVGRVAEAVPRLARYVDRFGAALAAVEGGAVDMVAHPMKDSYHTVWFELHEELIRLSGRTRSDEAAAGRA